MIWDEHETRLPGNGDSHADLAAKPDDFRIVRLIGRGGMGSVYEAYVRFDGGR